MPWQVLYTVKALLTLAAWFAWYVERDRITSGTRPLGAQLALAACVELSATPVSLITNNNLWLYTLYLFCEFALLMSFAYQQWDHRGYRIAVWCALPLFLLVAVPDLLRTWPLGTFPGFGYMASSALLLVAFVTLLFREALYVDEALFKQPLTWILLGMVLYFGGSIPIFGLLNAITAEDRPLASQLYIIMDVLFVLRYGMIVFALFLFPTRT